MEYQISALEDAKDTNCDKKGKKAKSSRKLNIQYVFVVSFLFLSPSRLLFRLCSSLWYWIELKKQRSSPQVQRWHGKKHQTLTLSCVTLWQVGYAISRFLIFLTFIFFHFHFDCFSFPSVFSWHWCWSWCCFPAFQVVFRGAEI